MYNLILLSFEFWSLILYILVGPANQVTERSYERRDGVRYFVAQLNQISFLDLDHHLGKFWNFFLLNMSSNITDPSDPKWVIFFFYSFMSIIKLNASGKRKSESGVDNSTTTQVNASPSSKGKSKAKDDHNMEEDDDDDDDEESEDEGSDEEVSHILATRHFVYHVYLPWSFFALLNPSFFSGRSWRWLERNRPNTHHG